jgi:hypothetical protein
LKWKMTGHSALQRRNSASDRFPTKLQSSVSVQNVANATLLIFIGLEEAHLENFVPSVKTAFKQAYNSNLRKEN